VASFEGYDVAFEYNVSDVACLGDQIGEFMLSRYQDCEDSWTFTTDPWTIVISELDGSEVMDV